MALKNKVAGSFSQITKIGRNDPPDRSRFNDSLPLGTIISSMLNYDDLLGSLHEEGDSASGGSGHTNWYPCDGRPIDGTDLGNIFSSHGWKVETPDLRGKFMRGLNEFHQEGQVPGFDHVRDGNPEDWNKEWFPGTYQRDNFNLNSEELLNLWSGDRKFESDNGSVYHGSSQGGASRQSTFRELFQSTSDVAKSETRPRNISVFFYIKVRY